jgi:hypothetical protein
MALFESKNEDWRECFFHIVTMKESSDLHINNMNTAAQQAIEDIRSLTTYVQIMLCPTSHFTLQRMQEIVSKFLIPTSHPAYASTKLFGKSIVNSKSTFPNTIHCIEGEKRNPPR